MKHSYAFKLSTLEKIMFPIAQLTLVGTLMPRTTSERRSSVKVSPCTLTRDPGKGGKLEAARSKLGGAALASATGLGLCISFKVRKKNTSYLKSK